MIALPKSIFLQVAKSDRNLQSKKKKKYINLLSRDLQGYRQESVTTGLFTNSIYSAFSSHEVVEGGGAH